MYAALALAFPFLVLLSPRLPLGFTHARLDEFLLFAWLPLALGSYLGRRAEGRRESSAFVWALLALFAVFAIGLIYGDGPEKWSQPNLKLVTRPLFVIANLIVLRHWMARSRLTLPRLGSALGAALGIATVLGFVALASPAFADVLTDVYSSGIRDLDEQLRFDMSQRAMSVFAGYDQASVSYALGAVVMLFVALNSSRLAARLLCFAVIAVLLLGIVTSARIGFVGVTVALAALLFLRRARSMRTVGLFLAMGAAGGLVVVPVAQMILPESTLERFGDVWNLFAGPAAMPLTERSIGLRAVVQTQVVNVRYPSGLDVVLGFGDDGLFVSDVGFVTVFVKYGVLGLIVVLGAIAAMATRGQREGRRLQASGTGLNPAANMLVPALMALFTLGAMKGGLYFTTYKVGELFAFALACAVVESEGAAAATATRMSLEAVPASRPATVLR